MQVKGIIFDVDGTLVDSNDQHVEAWQRAFQSLGHEVPRDRIAAEIGKGGDQLVPAILGPSVEQEFGSELRQRHTREFRHLIQQQAIRVLPGAVELLQTLQDRGLQTVLATSSKQEEFAAVERSCGVNLSQKADLLVTADDAEASKPAPDLVQAACDKLGLEPKACLMVGDTPYDAQASAQADVMCVGLLSGRQHCRQALVEAGAAAIYRDPADLLQHLEQVLNSTRV
ncbi:MAG: HAD family hydrolase [Bacillota bacterium]